ncbi:MAG TPA: hypothetical protein ENI07_14945 [Desulfobacterales bacterium]|nr:hypothetical protein [Desulfobacterales bacterium]
MEKPTDPIKEVIKQVVITEPKYYGADKKAIWLYQGVNIGDDNALRCPFCNKYFGSGKYPKDKQTFICSGCKGEVTLERLT